MAEILFIFNLWKRKCCFYITFLLDSFRAVVSVDAYFFPGNTTSSYFFIYITFVCVCVCMERERERGREGERMLFFFFFFFLSRRYFIARRSRRESYGAQVAPQIETPPGPSMFFFFFFVVFLLWFCVPWTPIPSFSFPPFFSNMHTRTWTRYVFLFSPSVCLSLPIVDDSYISFSFFFFPYLLLLLLYYDDDGER